MSEQLLTILKFCLLALLYLFFFRVLRAVWAELRAPALAPVAPAPKADRRAARKARTSAPVVAPTAPAAAAAAASLVVVEPAERRGQRFPIASSLVLGRAADCGVVVDDTYVSQHHARVMPRDGHYVVEDLGSTNGTFLNRKKVVGAMPVGRGDRIQVGNTTLELA